MNNDTLFLAATVTAILLIIGALGYNAVHEHQVHSEASDCVANGGDPQQCHAAMCVKAPGLCAPTY